MAEAMGFRTCARCGESKRADAFYPDPQSPGGVSPDCKACEGYWVAAGRPRPKRRTPAV